MRTEIEVNINSPIFEEFLENLNAAILRCVQEIYADNFSGGDIAAKISLEFEHASEIYAAGTDEKGIHRHKTYRYKKPNIEHKVTLTLKKREETKGEYNAPLELKKDNERFILSEVKKAQLSLSDMEDADHEND